MSADIKTGDYVVARHKETGDEIRSEVLAVDSTWIRLRIVTEWLSRGGWSFELVERPQPPLEDGVYQKGGAIRVRFEGRWFAPEWVQDCEPRRLLDRSDVNHADWNYIGPEASR